MNSPKLALQENHRLVAKFKCQISLPFFEHTVPNPMRAIKLLEYSLLLGVKPRTSGVIDALVTIRLISPFMEFFYFIIIELLVLLTMHIIIKVKMLILMGSSTCLSESSLQVVLIFLRNTIYM